MTGCAGFIGSNLVDRLLALGHDVSGYDNLSTGQLSFIEEARSSSRFVFTKGDLLDVDRLTAAMRGSEIVFHLAANADVRFGTQHPTKDLHQNTIATVNVLEAMRELGVARIAFSSTGSVYGEAPIFPTPENSPIPVQTSLYGASKMAAESFIEAYCEGFSMQAFVFRFVSILGERYTHGHVFDFYKQLKAHPEELYVLGNGKQRKSYLYVQDCIDAILMCIENCQARVSIFNLGLDEYCEVNDSIGWICEELGVRPELRYAGGDRGWVGDNPFIFLDCSAVRALGWRPKLSIQQGVRRTVRYLQQNSELLEIR
ncbi:MAG: NAD-dependent epimerase/dehydratase family protein [Acidobacteriaceae bacterium]|nr:NAD-dependent epimerase/dehydratase family protein [Acidobacteriaceae bacterium]MBV9767820.1 NAD-dependent epimerase/dehydratase family protein [Acidobacteriaceae bacterium]